MKYFTLLIFLSAFCSLNAQVKPEPRLNQKDSIRNDSLKFNSSILKASEKKAAKVITVEDYKIISYARDTISLDTTLSIKKEYKYNYLRKDDFELLPFSNVGQPYNALAKNFENNAIYPQLGAVAKNQKYFEVDDVDYYDVPTPLTELTFKTTFEQGQFLDALLALNTSRRFNVSLAFTGSRSLGKYDFNQSEAAIFRTTFNYRTKNNRYWVRGHYASQDIESEENGGITDVEQFESGDSDFLERSRIDVAFSNSNGTLADNRILGKRYFLDHQYNIVRPKKDSTKYRSTLLSIGHQFSYESKFYQFNQDAQSDVFGEAFVSSILDKSSLKTTFNQVSANFSNKKLGALSASLNLYSYDYFFNSLLVQDDGVVIPNRLEGEEVSAGVDYKNTIGPLEFSGKVRYNVSGELAGNLFDANVRYRINDNNHVSATINSSSRAPNFNFLLYQSDYQNFNWQNPDFERQQTQSLQVKLHSNILGDLTAKYSAIDNYTFFSTRNAEVPLTQDDIDNGNQNAFVRPDQENETINYLKVKYQKEFKWRKWALDNTLMYQNVSQTNQVLNVPDLVTRNTLYFSTDVFNKAMFVQTGVTFKYFTAYNIDGYNPLLGEFYTQNNEELGAFPLIDFFINAKVRQTRIFLKAEHLNTIWTKQYNFYAAPNYPYRDFVIRFGLVWNFFS